MFVIFKNMSGCDYPIYNDKGAVERVISFRGGCYANNISNDDYALLKKAYPSFEKAIRNGYIVVNDNQARVNEVVAESVAETKNEAIEKQKSTRKKTAAVTNVEVEEA